jgi:hypothetical protein
MRVEYHPAIEKELREIVGYYNVCSPGLGVEFLNEFERHILKITAAPMQWRTVGDDKIWKLANCGTKQLINHITR